MMNYERIKCALFNCYFSIVYCRELRSKSPINSHHVIPMQFYTTYVIYALDGDGIKGFCILICEIVP